MEGIDGNQENGHEKIYRNRQKADRREDGGGKGMISEEGR